MVEAGFYIKEDKNKVICKLCPHQCKIEEGKTGLCHVRTNHNGILYSDNYGKLSAINLDPIEKKPLYHFYPGSHILSLGSVGCNLKCQCCQNWEIAQTSVDQYGYFRNADQDEIIDIALNSEHNIGIAYTYNEPSVWYEYMVAMAIKVKENGMKNVVVSNGYLNEAPLDDLLHLTDAFNIDLKAFTEKAYHSLTKARLETVKKNIKRISKSHNHIEITNLIVPDINDDINDFKAMINWIADELGEQTVFHISRYFPSYRLSKSPTDISLLKEFYEIAREKLYYVYLGNVNIDESQDTFCSKCKRKVIERDSYRVKKMAVNKEGNCSYCNNTILINQ